MIHRYTPAELRHKWEQVPGVYFSCDGGKSSPPVYKRVPEGYVSLRDAAGIMRVSARQASKVLQPDQFDCCVVGGRHYWSAEQVAAFRFPELPQTPPEGYCTAEEAVRLCGCCYNNIRRLSREKEVATVCGLGKGGNRCFFYSIDDLKRYVSTKKRSDIDFSGRAKI